MSAERAATILVVNCNTSTAMTAEIEARARAVALPGTRIIATQPVWGPESVEGYYESYLSAAAVLERLAGWDGEPYDAVVMAGFGEHGREGARQLLEVPVVDITEAACALACLLGHRFGVVTTTSGAVAQIEQSIALAGFAPRCAAILPTGLGVLELGGERDHCTSAILREGAAALDAGAEVLVLGCSGMSGFAEVVAEKLSVPVVDGIGAAVGMCETLVGLGLRTSKHRAFAPPDPAKAPVAGSPHRNRIP